MLNRKKTRKIIGHCIIFFVRVGGSRYFDILTIFKKLCGIILAYHMFFQVRFWQIRLHGKASCVAFVADWQTDLDYGFGQRSLTGQGK